MNLETLVALLNIARNLLPHTTCAEFVKKKIESADSGYTSGTSSGMCCGTSSRSSLVHPPETIEIHLLQELLAKLNEALFLNSTFATSFCCLRKVEMKKFCNLSISVHAVT